MKRLVAALGLVVIAAGCMSIDQEATTTTTAPDGTVTQFASHSRIRAIGDGRNAVDKVRASAGKTASVGASGVDQETSSTNAAAFAGEIVGAAVRAAVKP